MFLSEFNGGIGPRIQTSDADSPHTPKQRVTGRSVCILCGRMVRCPKYHPRITRTGGKHCSQLFRRRRLHTARLVHQVDHGSGRRTTSGSYVQEYSHNKKARSLPHDPCSYNQLHVPRKGGRGRSRHKLKLLTIAFPVYRVSSGR
jgi:hypothetical protein